MTVEPGFGGQQLIKSQIEKIREIRLLEIEILILK